VDEWEYDIPFVLKLLLKVKRSVKLRILKAERIYNGDFIERIAKLEGFTPEEMAKNRSF
jgi:putative ABC transport system permease protein